MKWWFLLSIPIGVWAQEQPGLKARVLFYTAAPEAAGKPESQAAAPKKAPDKTPDKTSDKKPVSKKTAAPTPLPLGIRYAVLKRDAQGEYVEVDSSATFHSGDRIRLQINGNASGYLYVVHQGSSGMWRPLFPSAEVAGGSNHIRKGEPRIVPPGGQFYFDQQTGTEKLFLVLARQPQPGLDKLIYETPAPQNDATPPRIIAAPAIGDDVVAQLRRVAARDLIFEKVDSPGADGKVEYAAYVVNRSTAADARVVVDVALKHN
jgi:hypothetical protein